MIPVIDSAPLFGPKCPARDAVDEAILAAARTNGFMTIVHLPPEVPITAPEIERLLRIFALPGAAARRLWRQKFAPAHGNVYRGWFPLQNGHPTYKEGYDLGPDIAYGPGRVNSADPLCEATPLPPADLLPGWIDEAARYYKAMERVGAALLRAVARALELPENIFAPAFRNGTSTLRFLHYPIRPPESFQGVNAAEIWTEHGGERVDLVGKPHVDSGFVTLLCQHGIPGLQALDREGNWRDVPPAPDSLVVNFGKLLERWTGGRIRATEHRVIGSGTRTAGRGRYSVPFFYEPAVDAVIAPIPALGAPGFEPFLYGDLVWAAMMKFVEFEGLDHLRPQRPRIG